MPSDEHAKLIRTLFRAAAPLLAVLLASCVSIPWRANRYDVTLEGIEAKPLRSDLLALSEAWQNRTDASIDTSRLEREFRADPFNMERYLHAQGLNAARVSMHPATNTTRPGLVFSVANTSVYTLVRVEVAYTDRAPEVALDETNALAGAPVNFMAIDQHGKRLARQLRNAGHPYARVEDKAVRIDHARAEASAEYRIRAGAPMVMGEATVTGLRRVEEDFVRRRINWNPGDPYRQDTMERFSRSLTESALFSFVDISGPRPEPTSGVYDVSIRLQERRRRTIGVGVGYQSDTGPETTLLWQHRNLFGMGERFELDAKYGEDIWVGSAVLTLPSLLFAEHDLDLGIDAADEDSDAYQVRYERVFTRVRQRVNDDWSLLYGPALRYSTVEQLGTNENYVQVSLPASATWDKRNDTLDPTRGYALSVSAEPFYDIDTGESFIKSLVTPSVYAPLAGDTLSLGARLTLGSIAGADAGDVPADLRFYAGGGQSIRGYAYQSVGPRENGQPIGGLSLVESSLELRWRPGQRIGFVAFVDGGTSYEPEISDFKESYQWGAGLGFRYFTGVGPIRIDVGVPVNPRDDIDDDYEFYISVGQAF